MWIQSLIVLGKTWLLWLGAWISLLWHLYIQGPRFCCWLWGMICQNIAQSCTLQVRFIHAVWQSWRVVKIWAGLYGLCSLLFNIYASGFTELHPRCTFKSQYFLSLVLKLVIINLSELSSDSCLDINSYWVPKATDHINKDQKLFLF